MFEIFDEKKAHKFFGARHFVPLKNTPVVARNDNQPFLPRDIFNVILRFFYIASVLNVSFLSGSRIARLSSVCKNWNYFINSSAQFWKDRILSEFGAHPLNKRDRVILDTGRAWKFEYKIFWLANRGCCICGRAFGGDPWYESKSSPNFRGARLNIRCNEGLAYIYTKLTLKDSYHLTVKDIQLIPHVVK